MYIIGNTESEMPASKTTVAEYMKIRSYVLSLITKAGNEPVQLPTALELSKLFGVCRQTVGKALKQLAEENYVIGRPGLGTFTNPKKQFRFPASRKRLSIGIIVGDGMAIEMDEFVTKMLAACLVEVSTYPAFVRVVNLTSTKPDAVLKDLKNEFLDAVIWQRPPPAFLSLLEELKKSGITVITVGAPSHQDAICNVDFDLQRLGYECGKRLLQAGKNQILFLRDERPWNFPADGLRQAFQEAGVPLNEKMFLKGPDVLDKIKMIFELGVPVEAIFNPVFSYDDLAEIARQTDVDLGRIFNICWDSVAEKFPEYHGFSYNYDFAALAKEAVRLLRLQLEKKDPTVHHVDITLQIKEIP